MPDFPIQELLPRIRDSLAHHPRLVLEAPPGAGKTTQVPLALLDATWLQGRRIVMLEPRRVAARAAAQFMAAQLGESVGDTVGYRIRFDNQVSARTRIEVVTEGILTALGAALGATAETRRTNADRDGPSSWRRVTVADGVELHVREDSPSAADDTVMAMREAVRSALGRR